MIALLHRVIFGRKITSSNAGVFATYLVTDTGHNLFDGSNLIVK